MLEMIFLFFKNLADFFGQIIDLVADIIIYLFSAQI